MKALIISLKLILLAGTLFVLSACSFKTLYNNIDWVLAGMVDDYVTLSDQQEVDVEQQIKNLLKWHRKTQLSIYARDLKQIKEYTQLGLSDENIEITFNKFLGYWVAVRDRVSPEMAELFISLNEKQRLELFKRFDEQNKEIDEDFAESNVEEHRSKYADSLVDNFSDWVGELSSEQEALLERWSEKFKPIHVERMKSRNSWQTVLKDILSNEQSRDEEKIAQIIDLINKPEKVQTKEYKQQLSYNAKQIKALVLAFGETVSNEQKKHLAERLDHFSTIFLELAAEK